MSMGIDLRSLARILALAMAVVPAVCSAQESYPTRPVRFVVPFPPGSPADFLARIASQKLTQSWSTPVIVEVRDGAGGTIGVNHVVRSAPDGYTLLFTNELPITIAPVVSKTPYDPLKDLAPIGAVAKTEYVLVAHPSIGASSVRELIELAKAKPGALTFASSGEGSASRMCFELIRQAAGIDLVQISYRGAGPAIQAVLTGEVSTYCSPVFPALPHLRSGKLKALGVADTKPSAFIPGVAPIPAQGLPDVTVATWQAAFAPSGTPRLVLGKIRDSLRKAFDDAEVSQRLAAAGVNPIWMDETALSEAIRADLEKWSRIVQKTGRRNE
jgi:tripartite-type tricarboxylate transporter receptor subunit TctC